MKRFRFFALLLFLLLVSARDAAAHNMMTAFLDLTESADGTTVERWRRPIFPGTRVTLEPVFSDSIKPVSQESPRDEGIFFTQHSVLRGAPPSWSGIKIGLVGKAPAGIQVLVHLELANGQKHVAVLRDADDCFYVPKQAGRWDAARSYFWLGFQHILLGVDHLLFVLGLLFLVRGWRMLVKTITAFTIAHSITLAIATLGYASAPMAPLSLAIALSIFFLAPEMVRKDRGGTSITIRYPWVVAFAFGLLHGFGFASGLNELGLPRAEIPFALLLFNVGVEGGQLVFVLLVLHLGKSLKALGMPREGRIRALPAYCIGALGAFWTFERLAIYVSQLR